MPLDLEEGAQHGHADEGDECDDDHHSLSARGHHAAR